MPRRFVHLVDRHGVIHFNTLASCTRWRGFALFMAWAGSVEGSLFIWAALAMINHTMAMSLITSGVLGLIIFKSIKHLLRRPRPFISHAQHVVARSPAPDVFSFPSGHALHAASLAVLVSIAWPWAWPLGLVWYLAMAISRMMLGLHFPSDVLLGGILGAIVGWSCWVVFPF